MARKTQTVVIESAEPDDKNRDKGKTFLITEMAASKAERWATRALLALGQSGVDIPEDIGAAGLAGVAAIGIKAISGLPWELAEPLLDEMFQCVQFVPDASKPMVVRPLVEDDIEEVSTRLRLREEVISLHINFSIGAWISKLRTALTTAEPSLSTETSPSLSES